MGSECDGLAHDSTKVEEQVQILYSLLTGGRRIPLKRLAVANGSEVVQSLINGAIVKWDHTTSAGSYCRFKSV